MLLLEDARCGELVAEWRDAMVAMIGDDVDVLPCRVQVIQGGPSSSKLGLSPPHLYF